MEVTTDSPATWTRLITDNFISLQISDTRDTFEGALGRCDLGGAVRLTTVRTDRSRVRRDEHCVRADACDDLLLLSPLTGSAMVRQEGSACVVGPGALSIHVADRPYELQFAAPATMIVLQAPRRLVPSAALVSAQRRRAPADGALVRIFRAFATETLAAADQLSARAREELGATAAGLAVSVLGHDQPDGDSQTALVTAATSFIREHLSDRELSPAVVASHLRISLHSLRSAFATTGTSPSICIQTERLRRARHLLEDPRYRDLPIGRIGDRVGYTSPDVFIRAFKREFGRTPGAWRSEEAAP